MISSSSIHEKLKGFVRHKWFVFVCSMWDMSFAGTAYLFGSISPVIKTNMGYNQRQVALLSVAKDLGANVGLVAGKASESWPMWRVILLGVFQSVGGYSLLWLVVTHRLPSLPLWMLCIFILVGQNGSTYYNTASIVSSVRNFPQNRGPVVGILKGFIGLSTAIWTQIVAAINISDPSSLIFVMAIGPALVSLATMFIIRPLKDSFKQSTPSDDNSGFNFIYGFSVVIAAYLLSILLLQNMFDLDHETITLLAVVLIILLSLPILVPIVMVFFLEPKRSSVDEDRESEALFLVDEQSMDVATASMDMHGEDDDDETHVDEDHDGDHKPSEMSAGVSSMNYWSRGIIIIQSEANKFVEGIKKMMKKNDRRIGEEFSIREAVVNGELWIMFLSLSMSGGSGLTVINNIAQMCQSLGDNNVNVYVSVLSICGALGRVAGGYSSELIMRKFGHSRLVALVVVQGMMALGLSYYAMGLVGQIYVVAIIMGFCYGAHWSIAIATGSELFGLKNFGTIFNFLAISFPAGTLVLSGFVASTIYDYYAEQQRILQRSCYGNYSLTSIMPCVTRNYDDEELLVCEGNICFSLTCWILAIVCIIAAALNIILVYRTKKLYAKIYTESIII